MDGSSRETRFLHQLNRAIRDQTGLLGRFGNHGISGHQGSTDLAKENRQREVPRADTHKYTTTLTANTTC
ncbi:Uncharacterised protein [Vibrio cholerae]|uniref:Uncharacterized protein n=1 Tax=Vibrio cholerae TaxID=666 RepID=A0A655Q0I7_VIBCL|nr:Uncharacterised protein [Vibrio cholerae]CSA32414.1 Uncharacterised protein [Vibrio cholerae]